MTQNNAALKANPNVVNNLGSNDEETRALLEQEDVRSETSQNEDVQSATNEEVSPLTGDTPTEGTDGEEDDADVSAEDSEDGRLEVERVNKIVKDRVEKVRRKTREEVLREKEAEIEFWQSRAKEQKVASDFATLPPKPELVNYASNPAQYEKDLEAWAAKKGQVDAYKTKVQTDYVQRCAEYKQVVPDFDKSIKFFNSVTVSPALEAAILESPNGPKLAYHLSKNFKEFDRISAIQNPLTLVYELAKMELELTGAVKTTAPKQNPVPRPMKTVQGAKPVAKTPTYEEMVKAKDKDGLLAARKKAHQRNDWTRG